VPEGATERLVPDGAAKEKEKASSSSAALEDEAAELLLVPTSILVSTPDSAALRQVPDGATEQKDAAPLELPVNDGAAEEKASSSHSATLEEKDAAPLELLDKVPDKDGATEQKDAAPLELRVNEGAAEEKASSSHSATLEEKDAAPLQLPDKDGAAEAKASSPSATLEDVFNDMTEEELLSMVYSDPYRGLLPEGCADIADWGKRVAWLRAGISLNNLDHQEDSDDVPHIFVTPIVTQVAFDQVSSSTSAGQSPFSELERSNNDCIRQGLIGVTLFMPHYSNWEVSVSNDLPTPTKSKGNKRRRFGDAEFTIKTNDLFEVDFAMDDKEFCRSLTKESVEGFSTTFLASSIRVTILFEPANFFPAVDNIIIMERRICCVLSSPFAAAVKVRVIYVSCSLVHSSSNYSRVT